MKLLSNELRNLLDKLYNLRGEDSVLLVKMNREREEAIETQERTKNEKEVLLNEIEKLTNEEKVLAEQGNKLMDVLSSINKDDFATVLDRLKIDFNPDDLNAKLSKQLPETISRVVRENEKAAEKLASVEEEMNNAVTKVEELGLRKDEVLSNQAKLNEYFDMALSGNINITRDAITNLLEKFDFNENEQREAAKILMFPEDALYEYDAQIKSGEKVVGKTISEVLAEAKDSAIVKNAEDDEEIDESGDASELTEIFDKVIKENTIINTIEVQSFKPTVEDVKEVSEKEKLASVMEEVNLDTKDFTAKSLAKILEHYDVETLKNNVKILNEKNIDLKILRENFELLYDKELQEKLNKLLEIGKEPNDICLMPHVLVKYDLKGLTNTINVIQISGLDPRKVPLMAY